MQNDIEFVYDWFAEIEDKRQPGRSRQVAFKRGSKLQAKISTCPDDKYLADLQMADGTTARKVPLSHIMVAGH